MYVFYSWKIEVVYVCLDTACLTGSYRLCARQRHSDFWRWTSITLTAEVSLDASGCVCVLMCALIGMNNVRIYLSLYPSMAFFLYVMRHTLAMVLTDTGSESAVQKKHWDQTKTLNLVSHSFCSCVMPLHKCCHVVCVWERETDLPCLFC